MEMMNWKDFKNELLANPQLTLQFKYADDKWVDASYHITEIKRTLVNSVDCGGVLNAWTEVVVQLWEPEGQQEERAMEVSKALSIIQLVEKSLPLNPDAVVKVEFGNSTYDTRQLLPKGFIVDGDNLTVDLRPDSVTCKAIERGGSCGTTSTGEECCAPPVQVKPKIQLVNLASSATACTPGSGCC
ncbi:DUF6428 family protein [Mucilaginibacter aquatilis]|uniref:Uncharacterized protein n=1 Tax=Mucilaginibacter aquatilis TaxID=1517760 RepID=A0A6I4I3S5_9SPHI|nr:DUF6428 family protein [Mucilaginibacter aquatilis]MVN89680.1 hypothetical protein [Mucilaginibacter aquatilis]